MLLTTILDFCGPLFLQKILQAMENPESPRSAALTYSFLALIFGLLEAQIDLFTLWYQRRCYERSRGELITMLYEKTLTRKVVSISTRARTDDNSNLIPNGNGKIKPAHGWRKAAGSVLSPIRACFGRSKAKSSDKDELATMGKILNLMR